MVVVDTNIIVPLYVRSASTDAVKELRGREEIWRTDPFALIEFSNVLITYERARYLTAGKARECLGNAESFLRPHYFPLRTRLPWIWRFATELLATTAAS